MAEHRVSMLGSFRRFEDPSRSADPRIRQIVSGLRALEIAPPARPHFRSELRAQLVAVAPRLIAEGVGVEEAGTSPTRLAAAAKAAKAAEKASLPAASRLSPERRTTALVEEPRGGVGGVLAHAVRLPFRRPLAVVTAAIAVCALLLGGAVWMSRSALPGDSLYGLKRASENVQLSLDSSAAAKASDLLSFAGRRADEASALVGDPRAVSGSGTVKSVSGHTAGLVTSTLGSADADLTRAAQLLGHQAVRQKSAKPLLAITNWAPGQIRELRDLVARIPAGPLHERAAASLTLVEQALARAKALIPALNCACMSGAAADRLGPIPCTVCSQPATGQRPSTTTPTTGPGSAQPPGTGPTTGHRTGSAPDQGGPTPGAGTDPTNNSRSSTGAARSTPGGGPTGGSSSTRPPITLPPVSVPPITVPTRPVPGPSSAPVNVDSCGLHISLGPISVGAGSCGIHVGL